jgi:hypothetical protein
MVAVGKLTKLKFALPAFVCLPVSMYTKVRDFRLGYFFLIYTHNIRYSETIENFSKLKHSIKANSKMRCLITLGHRKRENYNQMKTLSKPPFALHKPALSERTCLNFLKLIKLTD